MYVNDVEELVAMAATNSSLVMDNHTMDTTQLISQDINFYAKVTIQPVIFASGVLTNTLTFLALRRMPLNGICRLLLTSLSISDLCAAVFGLTFVLLDAVLLGGRRDIGHSEGEYVATTTALYVYCMFLSISSTILVLITVVKCYFLRCQLKALGIVTRTRVARMLALLVAIVFVLFLPFPLIVFRNLCKVHHSTYEPCRSISSQLPSLHSAETYFNSIALAFGPAMTLTHITLWIWIKRLLEKHTSESTQLQQSVLNSAEKKERHEKTLRVTRMFMWVLLLNSICLGMFSIKILTRLSSETLQAELIKLSTTRAVIINTVTGTLLALVPCTNFWAYMVTNKDFKKEVRCILQLRGKTIAEGSSTLVANDVSQPNLV